MTNRLNDRPRPGNPVQNSTNWATFNVIEERTGFEPASSLWEPREISTLLPYQLGYLSKQLRQLDSNEQPVHYEWTARPIELCRNTFAEADGLEPPSPCGTTDFKSAWVTNLVRFHSGSGRTWTYMRNFLTTGFGPGALPIRSSNIIQEI